MTVWPCIEAIQAKTIKHIQATRVDNMRGANLRVSVGRLPLRDWDLTTEAQRCEGL
jgi:hypothetical protein